MPTITDALAGARYQAPAMAQPSVLIAGAAGRLGERVLAHLLGSGKYRRIHALASEPMRSTESRLHALTLAQWQERVDHVIAVVDDRDPVSPAGVSRRRTEVFCSLASSEVLALAQRAESLGVARFMLVTPIQVLSQPMAMHAQLSDPMEMQLHRMGFESLLLVRPSDHEIRMRRSGMGQRFWRLLVDTAAGLMVGARHAPLSLDNTARALVQALLAGGDGLDVIEMDRLHRILKP
jgi:uncharacterized protein YbjT (DUF2867 family)